MKNGTTVSNNDKLYNAYNQKSRTPLYPYVHDPSCLKIFNTIFLEKYCQNRLLQGYQFFIRSNIQKISISGKHSSSKAEPLHPNEIYQTQQHFICTLLRGDNIRCTAEGYVSLFIVKQCQKHQSFGKGKKNQEEFHILQFYWCVQAI